MVVLSTVEDEEEADDNMSTNCTTEVYDTLTTAMTTIKLQYTRHDYHLATIHTTLTCLPDACFSKHDIHALLI